MSRSHRHLRRNITTLTDQVVQIDILIPFYMSKYEGENRDVAKGTPVADVSQPRAERSA